MGAALVGGERTGHASDHADAPSLETDTIGDIADVFAFMSPTDASRLVLVMTVDPGAKDATSFPTDVEYRFRIKGVVDPTTGELDPAVDSTIVCRFQDPSPGSLSQAVLCNGNGYSAFGTVGAVAGQAADAMRVFAGRRADPAFGDLAALKSSVSSGALTFSDAGAGSGTNSFAGKNVLGIVVELDIDTVLFSMIIPVGPQPGPQPFGGAGGATGPRPLIAVSGETERLP